MKKILTVLILLIISITISTLDTYALDPEIVGPDVIYKQVDKILTMSQIKALYSSTYGDIVITNDEYTGFGDVAGIYPYTVGVTGETFIKEAEVSVRQTIGNVIAVTLQDLDHTIHIYKSTILSPQDIIDVLVRIQLIVVNSTTHITILTNTYTENAAAPGIYNFEFRLATTSGLESTHEVFIRVNNSEELTPDVDLEPVTPVAVGDYLDYIILGILLVVVVALVIYRIKHPRRKKR